jgi:tRNA A37 N6-isopentenylltransferase MiaA
MGIFGFLSKAHLDQTAPTGDVAAKIERIDNSITRERTRITRAETQIVQLDKAIDSIIDKNNRAQTALQIRNQQKKERNFTPMIIGLEAERSIMYDRINQRVDIMMREGLLEEAKTLFPNKQLNALQTVGYSELFDYLEGAISLDFAVDEIKKNTRRFAKRQMTWFKRPDTVVWYDYLTNRKEIIDNLQLIIKR